MRDRKSLEELTLDEEYAALLAETDEEYQTMLAETDEAYAAMLAELGMLPVKEKTSER